VTKKYAREHKQPDNKTGKQTRSSLFWKVMQHWLVFSYRHFGIAYRLHFQGPSPETPVANYHSTLRNIPEERRPRLHRGGSRKSRKLLTSIKKKWNNNNSTSTNEGIMYMYRARQSQPNSPHSEHCKYTVYIRTQYIRTQYIRTRNTAQSVPGNQNCNMVCVCVCLHTYIQCWHMSYPERNQQQTKHAYM
jgi:hypothetical protein